MLAANDGRDQWLQHTGAAALASIGDSAALEALASHPSAGARRAAVVALRRLRHAGVARFLADTDQAIVTDAARAINDDGGIATALPQLAALLGAVTPTNEPLLRRALNANLRLGTAAAVARVEAFARDDAASSELRIEAIASLGVWGAPSPMDRVDGFYHDQVTLPRAVAGGPAHGDGRRQAAGGRTQAAGDGVGVVRAGAGQTGRRRTARAAATPSRDAVAARAAVERLVQEAKGASAADVDVKVALAEAAGRIEAKNAAPVLEAQLRSDPSVMVRTASLRGLQAMKAGDMGALMQTALADKDPLVRRAALALLPGLAIPAAAKANHLAALVKTGGVPEQQGALEVLGALKSVDARRLLATYLDDLDAGRLAPVLQIDLVDAVQTDASPTLLKRLDAYQRKQQADALIKAVRAGAIVGGDARKGQQVLTQNPLAECTRCHAIRGRGSDVGPDLTKIGATLTRDQLFEALVEPNKRIAPGYGMVGITLNNGDRIDGTVREETATEVVVMTGVPAVPRRVKKADIAERTDPVSAMPPLGLILKPREVRDLVEFLSGLR